MNNIFNINRFALLLRRQWLEFGKIYLVSLLVLVAIITSFYGFQLYSVSPAPYYFGMFRFRYPLFCILGILFVTIIASGFFGNLSHKQRAVIDLMIPASTFEKFLTSVFFTAILSPLSFGIIFFVIDTLFVSAVSNQITSYTSEDVANKYTFLEFTQADFRFLYGIPFLLTSIFLLGSVYFNRFHYIKTAASLFIFTGFVGYLLFRVAKAMSEGMVMLPGAHENFTKEEAQWYLVVISIVLTLIFWTITFYRVKEKEV